jgi:hypothetical protein
VQSVDSWQLFSMLMLMLAWQYFRTLHLWRLQILNCRVRLRWGVWLGVFADEVCVCHSKQVESKV